jgi:hypothetical protein
MQRAGNILGSSEKYVFDVFLKNKRHHQSRKIAYNLAMCMKEQLFLEFMVH